MNVLMYNVRKYVSYFTINEMRLEDFRKVIITGDVDNDRREDCKN